ncbi:mRNA turnover 4, partial [Irineochytrium annulatum]
MPKSKRNKVVSLTKTDSKTKESKSKLIDKVTECLSSSFLHPLNPRCHSRIKQIRTSIDSNPHLYLIHIANDRNEHLQALRTTLKAEHAGSCMFLGKNRVMAKAVGVTVEEEYAPRLRMMGERLKGKVGLLSSGLGRDEVSRILSIHTASDFARGGCKATRTLILPEGPLRRLVEPLSHTDLVGGLDGDEEDYFKAAGVDAVNAGAEVIASFPGTMETQLRGLGLPTLLQG